MPDHAVGILRRDDELPTDWSSGRGMFGGYLIHRAVSAARRAGGSPMEPMMLSATFPRSAVPGPVTSEVTTMHRGRANCVLEYKMRQDRTCFAAIVHLAPRSPALGVAEEPRRPPGSMAGVPRMDMPFTRFIECERLELDASAKRARASMRCVAPDCRDGYAEVSILLDAVDPVLVLCGTEPFVPTVHMQIDFHPALWARQSCGEEWLDVEQELQWMNDTHCMEVSTVRDSRGVVLGHCRQVRAKVGAMRSRTKADEGAWK